MNRRALKSALLQNARGEVSEVILDYIVKNVSSVLFMNIDRLAYSTQSTVRELQDFIEALGFSHFLDMKAALRKYNYLEKENNQVQHMGIRSIADNMMRCEMQNLTEFFNDLDYDLLDRFVQDLTAASEVVLIGMRSSMPYAYYAATMWSRVGIKAYRSDIRDCNVVDFIATLSRSALIVTMGFPRYHKASVVMASMFKNQGYRLVAITDSPQSPVAKMADYGFYLPIHSYDFSDSYTAGTMLINLITFRIGLLDSEAMLQRLNSHEQISTDMEVFF